MAARPAVDLSLSLALLLLGCALADCRSRPQPETAPDPSSAATTQASTSPRALEVRRNPKDGLEYVFIPAGSFEMGCLPSDSQCSPFEKPRHRVKVTRDFWLGRMLATAEAYKRSLGDTGRSIPQGFEYTRPSWKDRPAQSLSWDDAVAFCRWSAGRLPTEAEWEYAARGGKDGLLYPWGTEYPWAEVGKRPFFELTNGFGLDHMTGIAAQWCSDWYDEAYYSSSPSVDPAGPSSGLQRVLRGRSSGARQNSSLLRSSYREGGLPHVGYAEAGVRCARDVPP